MKGPPGPPPPSRPPRSLQADDSVETTTPDLDPRATPRAPAPSVRAMAFLDNEPTTVRVEPRRAAPDGDLFAELTPPPDPTTLPVVPQPSPVVAPALVEEMFASDVGALPPDAPRVHTLPPSSRLGLFSPSVPSPSPSAFAQVAVPPPPPRPSSPSFESVDSLSDFEVVPPPPRQSAPAPLPPAIVATLEDEPFERSVALDLEGLPCSLRELLNQRKFNPNIKLVEDVAVHLTKCVQALHEQGVVLGERLVPERFVCDVDLRVSYSDAAAQPPREIVELYMAPELFRGRPPTVQSDIFAVSAIVYEALVGRSTKPMFLPQVVQVSRTDTWFSDPGASMRDPYRFLLRQGLSERPSKRHESMRVFSEALLRAWRLTHNPEVRRADVAPADDQWKRFVVPGIVIAAFVLLLLGMLLFPVERIDAPPIPAVRPELSQ